MRKFACILLIALAACSNNSEPQAIQGEWTIHKELAAAPIVGISDEETTGLIGDKLSISAKRSEEHTSELQSRSDLVCRLLLEKKKTTHTHTQYR